jgi:hypothetical protein
MKAWFAKMRISAALDGGRRPAAWPQRKTSVSDELSGFEQEMAELDRALKHTAPKPHASPGLHSSIMRAVQAAELPGARARGELSFLRWLPVPVVAALALMVIWHAALGPVRLPAQHTEQLSAATTVLQVGGEMARAVPSAVVNPLADELKNINRDLDNTAQFLLASLP